MPELKPRDFADIWAFVRVVDTGSFSQAARQVGSTKAAVSKAVARLEGALQVKLLNRSTRCIGLSEAGRAIHAHAQRMVDEARAIEATLAGMQAGPSGTLRVSTSMAFGNSQLASLLPEFMARYPAVRVVLNLSDRHIDLVEEGIDVALRLTPKIDLMSAVARPVAPLRYVLAASPGYIERSGMPPDLDALDAHRCLTFADSGPGATWNFERDGIALAFRPAAALAINSSQMLREAVLGGAGIAMLPTFVVGEDIRSGRAAQVLPALRPVGMFGSQVSAVYLHDRFLPQKVRVFIDYLLEKMGEHPPWDAFMQQANRELPIDVLRSGP
ncbi:LysR family transcriptional regulator [Massilia sp.]|uniref:LysR family transcriptional regulator n=1 Tax=Massilia sp. TaxID=1882437 RepID=UPI00289A07CE|nr:LysR family transcriptional regulator [Massilia sp.]